MIRPQPRSLVYIFVFSVLAVLSLSALASRRAASPRAQEAVFTYADAHPGDPVRVIIQAEQAADPAELAVRAGGAIRTRLDLINAVAADVPAGSLAALATSEGVKWVSLDVPVTSTATSTTVVYPTSGTFPASVYPQEIGADTQWAAGNKGQTIGIAVVDTGIFSSSADFADTTGHSRVVSTHATRLGLDDGYGHGSHVAGLAAGNGAVSSGRYVGVAPGANLISVRVSDDNGTSYESDVISGLQWISSARIAFNIKVVNLSLASSVAQSYTTDPLDAAVELLTFNGILVVAAAGNTGTVSNAVSFAPANDPFVLTVGAVDDLRTASYGDDTVPSWSSRGRTQDGFAKPDVSAPGRGLYSVLSLNSVLATTAPSTSLIGNAYLGLSGTSMAAGVASGAAALVFKAHPDYTPGQVKAAIMASAVTLPSDASAKLLQVGRAISLARPSDPTPNTKPNELLLSAAGQTNPHTMVWTPTTFTRISWGSIDWNRISWGNASFTRISWGNK